MEKVKVEYFFNHMISPKTKCKVHSLKECLIGLAHNTKFYLPHLEQHTKYIMGPLE